MLTHTKPQVLYRHFDADGTLLYVGITDQFGSRTKQHQRGAHWFSQVALVKVEHFATRDEVVAAEYHAIINERPLYNKVHNRHMTDAHRSSRKIFGHTVPDTAWRKAEKVARSLCVTAQEFDELSAHESFPAPRREGDEPPEWNVGQLRNWVVARGWLLMQYWNEWRDEEKVAVC